MFPLDAADVQSIIPFVGEIGVPEMETCFRLDGNH